MPIDFTIEKNITFNEELSKLVQLYESIREVSSYKKRIEILDLHPNVQKVFSKEIFWDLQPYDEYLIKQTIAINQHHFLLPHAADKNFLSEALLFLHNIEKFYSDIGGIIGYQLQVYRLLLQAKNSNECDHIAYDVPFAVDIRKQDANIQKYILSGIKVISNFAYILPVGGAADRLNLKDPETLESLPAAKLNFCGHTLLEGIIRDLQGIEYLHYKLFNKQVTVPIAMMTSKEKHNDFYIRKICEDNGWFGRDPKNFSFFKQPLVPAFTQDGNWVIQKNGQLLVKPGGHGVIWRLAETEGIFTWLQKRGAKKGLVRQINNPVAGVDHGILAFLGIGMNEKKKFGFASCPRLKNANEGVNAIKIFDTPDGSKRKVLTNVEYCDVQHLKQIDQSKYFDGFLANANLLFIDIETIQQAVKKHPYPGVILNFKDKRGIQVARLELTMQNIAEYFDVDTQVAANEMPSFITLNNREKTLSAAKRCINAKKILETPQGCFFDCLLSQYHLLKDLCGMQLDPPGEPRDFKDEVPPFLFLYHPALGPLYSIISQKIKGGLLSKHSELQLEIADIYLENVHVQGSFIVKTPYVMGDMQNNVLRYSENTGRCYCRNVRIKNAGIDASRPNVFWKNEVYHKQSFTVLLGKNAEFIAQDVTIEGQNHITVPDNTRCIAKKQNNYTVFEFEKLKNPKPFWNYNIEADQKICLRGNYE